MPTKAYAQWQENKRLRNALDNRDRAIRDLRGIIARYMQHVIETKGTSFLDRYGLMPSDSKALTLLDMSILREIEKEVLPKCDMPSRADGRLNRSTSESSNKS